MVFRTDRPGTHRQCTTLSIPDLSGDPSGRSRLARWKALRGQVRGWLESVLRNGPLHDHSPNHV